MNLDFQRMQKIVDRINKLQPSNPPPDTRFKPEELEIKRITSDDQPHKKAQRQLMIKKSRQFNVGKLQYDEKQLSIQKENYLKKKQRELEMEQVKKELAEYKRSEKAKIEAETQKAILSLKEQQEKSQVEKELKIKKKIDNEYLKKKINQSNHYTSIDASYVSITSNPNQSLIKKQIQDFHTLPREQYNRAYKISNSPPKAQA